MEYKVKNLTGEIEIGTAKTIRGAIRMGRKHEKEISNLGGCGHGFIVLDENGKEIRRQTCDNFGNHWHEA